MSEAAGPGPGHGATGYVHYGCRCPECTEANTQRARVQQARRMARMRDGDPAVPHGTSGGYTNWGCRCPDCTKANTDCCLAHRRDRKKAASAGRGKESPVLPRRPAS